MQTATRPARAHAALFDEDFDTGATRRRTAEPPPPPPPTPAEIEAQVARAYGDGLSEGMARATADRAEITRRLLETIADQMQATRADVLEAADTAAAALSRLIFRCLTASFPALEKRLGPDDAATFARLIVESLYDVPQIVVRANPHAVPALTAAFDAFDTDLRARIEITPTDALSPGDTRISWGAGHATRDPDATWRRTLEALAGIGLAETSDLPHLIAQESKHDH